MYIVVDRFNLSLLNTGTQEHRNTGTQEHRNTMYAKHLAHTLLDIGAVTLRPAEPFTWASGWRSPIYCDNRLIMGYPEVRAMTTGGFQRCIEEQNLKPELIAGTATAGIPHAAWLAHAMNLPMIYVRSKPKEHGRGNQIEGPATPGQRAVVIEDLISTGKSSVAVVERLQQEGIHVQAVLAIFSYGFEEATRNFEAVDTPFFTLTNYETLIQIALEKGEIGADALDTLRAWRHDPGGWEPTPLRKADL